MVDIIGIDNLSEAEIRQEVDKGGKFVQYIWCISVVFMTFKRASDIYFIPSHESATKNGLSYTFLTLFLGWWGIPWGPIYSLQCLGTNLSGGYDHTQAIMASFREEPQLEVDDAPDFYKQPVSDTITTPVEENKYKEAAVIARTNDNPVIKRR